MAAEKDTIEIPKKDLLKLLCCAASSRNPDRYMRGTIEEWIGEVGTPLCSKFQFIQNLAKGKSENFIHFFENVEWIKFNEGKESNGWEKWWHDCSNSRCGFMGQPYEAPWFYSLVSACESGNNEVIAYLLDNVAYHFCERVIFRVDRGISSHNEARKHWIRTVRAACDRNSWEREKTGEVDEEHIKRIDGWVEDLGA